MNDVEKSGMHVKGIHKPWTQKRRNIHIRLRQNYILHLMVWGYIGSLLNIIYSLLYIYIYLYFIYPWFFCSIRWAQILLIIFGIYVFVFYVSIKNISSCKQLKTQNIELKKYRNLFHSYMYVMCK